VNITAITPTADRPIAFALCEALMRRQTVHPDEWIVADGGETPTSCTMGQIHIHAPRPPGAANFANNLLNALRAATGDLVVIVEDDDFVRPDHIERMAELAARGCRLIGSEDVTRYYNVARRCYRLMNNVGASLSQTALRRELLPLFRQTIETCMSKGSYGIDTTLWRAAPRSDWAFVGQMTVLGIKGLPGRAGLGIGHRPDNRWIADPHLAKLREWIGADADTYAGFALPQAA
jgi:hypothetical protein